jgi:hypothetical protein
LTIELLAKFDFGHPIPKPDIISHQTIDIVHI